MQAGAMTGFTASFTEGPIDFYKSQVQVQIIRTQSDPNYKRMSLFVTALCNQLFAMIMVVQTFDRT